MIGFKINVLLTRLADKVLNKIGIHVATFIKREFFFSVFEAISVITPVTNKIMPYQKLLDFVTR